MRKRILISVAAVFGVILLAYLGTAVFFMGHFLPGTRAGEKDLSMKDPKVLDEMLKKEVEEYELALKVPSGESDREIITGKDISLTISAGEADRYLQKQNAFLWPLYLLGQKKDKIQVETAYDMQALEQKIRELRVVTEGGNGPVSARPEFDGERYQVTSEKYGVLMERLEEKIRAYIEELEPEIDLMEEECLQVPEYLSTSPEVEQACEELNQYCGTSVTYTMDQNIVVDAPLISGWLRCSTSMEVTLDEAAVREWMREFGQKYDTQGKTRTITTPGGKTVEVSGGTYGWIIDEETETQALIDSIRNHETVTKEPACLQRAAAWGGTDWGGTYLEVDLSSQYMWYIKDGAAVLATDVVTGSPTADMATPSGVYSILYTQAGAVLIGAPDPETGEPIYKTKVRYWMPFTQQGHGFHDADWQTAFGGNVYTYSGSHGCVNMPVDRAGELFGMLEAGTPVVVHW